MYGPDIASYPVKIVMKENPNNRMRIQNAKSGDTHNETIRLALVDIDGQEITSDDTSQIGIFSVHQSSSIFGTNTAIVRKGVTEFDHLVFVSDPGSSNIPYRASSVAIDQSKLASVDEELLNNSTISVNFRF